MFCMGFGQVGGGRGGSSPSPLKRIFFSISGTTLRAAVQFGGMALQDGTFCCIQ